MIIWKNEIIWDSWDLAFYLKRFQDNKHEIKAVFQEKIKDCDEKKRYKYIIIYTVEETDLK